MSGLPPIATEERTLLVVRFVPRAEVPRCVRWPIRIAWRRKCPDVCKLAEDQLTTQVNPRDAQQMREWLFTLPAFYAEFAPLAKHIHFVDHLYVLKDRGLLTAPGRSIFASPFRDVAFTFPGESAGGAGRVALVKPSFGHRKRKTAFHGWAFGVRTNAASSWPSATDRPAVADCLAQLAQVMCGEASCSSVLKILDQFLDDETTQRELRWSDIHGFLQVSQSKVREAATRLGRSPRTLQRKVRTSTGLSPKQLLAVQRFDCAVHTVPAANAKLAHIAGDLRFADQAHLAREFRRHAGLSPGAFRQMWQSSHGQAVRFFQDSSPTVRLRVALWAIEDTAALRTV
jgi:AraC-like DNA-binding protein